MKKTNIKEILDGIKAMNLPYTEFVRFMEDIHDPFIVLIACILSLRTNDRTTYPATMRMLELGKTPEDFAALDEATLEKAIYPVGFYRNKAKQIIKLSKKLCENHNGTVPKTIEELTQFDGVGRKTANLVQSKGYNLPSICVDVHVHRISNRMGLVKTNTPEETEFALKSSIPEKYWSEINTLFVTLGQNVCKPQKPLCEKCALGKFCETGKTR